MQETDMNLDATRIRQEREKRAWTQEQLAEIAGLGVRTVQRIEATGIASFESAAALSSALVIPVSDLKLASGRQDGARRWLGTKTSSHLWGLLIALLVALILSPPLPILFVALWSSLWLSFEIGIAVAARRTSS